MDIDQEIQFGQNEQIPNNNGSCLLDSENSKGSILDLKENKAGGIDVNRNNIVNAPFGSESSEGLDHNVENLSGFREKEDDFVQISEFVRDEEKNFVSGDIVWVMMKTKLWWPGFINEPSSKPPKKKFIDKDCFQVKLFSSPSSVWASKSQLKEFTCCFDEMVKQDNSRTFIAAVERAVNEISSYVKNELTCSCFQKPCPPKVLELKSFALSRFEPDKFLAFIKGLAIDGVVPQRVQIIVTRDCVSAFYRSLGHQQLQVHQLSPNRNSSRKRSRNETEIRKDLKKECVYGSSVADVAKIMKSSSNEVFDDLCWAAVDGSVRKERRHSASLTRFLSCYRRFAFSENDEKAEKPRNDCNKPEKPKGGDNATEVDSSSVKPKKKRQRKINLNPENVDEGQVGLDETKPEKKTVLKKREAKTASKIPDLNANAFKPGYFFPITGQHAMSPVGGFQITGPLAMSSVGGFLVNGQQAMPFGGFPVLGQHAMSSVGYIQIPGHAMAPPSVGGGVQTTPGHAIPSVNGFPVLGHSMPLFGGGVQIPGHAMSSVVGVQTTTGHAMSSVGGVQTTTGHAMSSVGGVQTTTGHAMSVVGVFPVPSHAMPAQIPGLAMSSVGGVQTTNGHTMSSVGGVQTTKGHVMSVGGVPAPSTGHTMSSNGAGFRINGHCPITVTSENEGNLTNMESAFINNGVGWLDSKGNSMSFLQLLNDVQGGKGFENKTFPLPTPQSAFSRPFESNHINFSSHQQPQTNPIPTPELKKKRKRKPKENPPFIINTVTPSSLPDLNGTTTTATESNSNHQPLVKKINKPPPPPPQPSSKLWPKNGFKPVTLPSPPGFGPPRASGAPPGPPQSTPDLAEFMKQKIEMMKSAMEKAGNSLSTEMRGKLENEIRGFTEKYNSMLGSSSSSQK